jgi:hypothetical protein
MTERRQLGLAAAIAAVTGEAIALGIFLTPATMAKSLGSPLLLAAVWCAMAGRWWYPAAPILFLLGCAAVALLILLHDPLPALLGIVMVLAGDVLRRLFLPGIK